MDFTSDDSPEVTEVVESRCRVNQSVLCKSATPFNDSTPGLISSNQLVFGENMFKCGVGLNEKMKCGQEECIKSYCYCRKDLHVLLRSPLVFKISCERSLLNMNSF